MASARRKGSARRDPNFDAAPNPELRLRPQDRPAGGYTEGRSAARPSARGPRKRKSGGGGGRGRRRSLPVRLAYWGAVLALWGVIAAVGVVAWIGAHLPPIQSLEIPKRPPSIQIIDVAHHVLVTRGDMGGGTLTLKDLPPYVPKAFIAIEDRRFYSHFGVDPLGIIRAVIANLLHRGVSQGGSTITQQLAKNLFLSPERSLERKLQEVGLAIWL